MKFKQDPSILSWIGGSVLSKLEGARDMFVSRQKYLRGRGDALKETFQQQAKRIREEKTFAWKKNGGNDPKEKDMSKEKKAAIDEKEE